MARQLDERQLQELAAFVNAIAEAAGYTTTAEWARDSGYPPPKRLASVTDLPHRLLELMQPLCDPR